MLKRSTVNRLVVVVVALVVFVVYVSFRDTIRVRGALSPKEQRQIIAGIQEWSAVKLFRHIEIDRPTADMATARVRESGNRWSVTVFMKNSGAWKKSGWYLLEECEPTVLRKEPKPTVQRQETRPAAAQPRSNSAAKAPPARKR